MHGADYFRRWHRRKEISGGLLVHKSSHHFDLVNWWLADAPDGRRRRWSALLRRQERRRARAHGSPGSVRRVCWGCLRIRSRLDWLRTRSFALSTSTPKATTAYIRDQDVFSPGITIEDNMGLLVTYRSGAILTYSLNAHAPWEGYRVSINGTEGRLELEVVERSFVGTVDRAVDPSVNPDDPTATATNPRPAGERILLQRHWEPAQEIPIPAGEGGHGGGDNHLLDDIFRPSTTPDPLHHRAGYQDGLRSVAVGIAANRSLETGSAGQHQGVRSAAGPLRPSRDTH